MKRVKKPALPDGWRWLNSGERSRVGDMYAIKSGAKPGLWDVEYWMIGTIAGDRNHRWFARKKKERSK